jgi:hypothetical protein
MSLPISQRSAHAVVSERILAFLQGWLQFPVCSHDLDCGEASYTCCLSNTNLVTMRTPLLTAADHPPENTIAALHSAPNISDYICTLAEPRIKLS